MIAASIGMLALTGLAWALAYWDVGRRRAENERQANGQLVADVKADLDAHQDTYKAALNSLITEVYDVVDKSRDDSTRIAYHVAGKEPPKAIDPWIARLIAGRAEERAARQRQRTRSS